MNTEIDISVVIPAFNEARRLPPFLNDLISYCNASKRKYEIIVVDDGSDDNTYQKAVQFKSLFPGLHVLRMIKNQGAGYVTKCGFSTANGRILVSMDADGSVSAEEIERNISLLGNDYDVIVGSRALKSSGQVLKINLFRRIISAVFNFFVRIVLSIKIKDTQCGFIMLKKDIMKPLFSRMRLKGFGSYIELLYLADKIGYKVKEVPISWEYKSGTKVKFVRDSIAMFFNLFQVRYWHRSVTNYISG